jgi:hypothetical protein
VQLLQDIKNAVKGFSVKLQTYPGSKCSADPALNKSLEQMLLHVIRNAKPSGWGVFAKDIPNAQLLWTFLLKTSSADVVSSIERQILGDDRSAAVRCRAWIKLALDNAELISTALDDRDALAAHYGPEAGALAHPHATV